MTYPDLHLFAVIETILQKNEDFLKPHKKLQTLLNKVAEHPNVVEYLQKREETDY